MGKWHHGVKRSTCLYNQQAASKYWPDRSPLIICEGPPCVLRFHEAGISGAVAVMGNTLADSQHHCLHLLIWPGRKVFIAADNDEGGETFATDVKRKISGAWAEGRDVEVIRASGAKDFGDMTTPAVREWMHDRLAMHIN